MAKGNYNNRLIEDVTNFQKTKREEKPEVKTEVPVEKKEKTPRKPAEKKTPKRDRKADLFTKSLELPKDLAQRAKEAAALEGVSLNTFIQKAIEHELKNNEEMYQKIREFKANLK